MSGNKRDHWRGNTRWEKETKPRDKPRTEYGGHPLFQIREESRQRRCQKGERESGGNFKEKKLGDKGEITTKDAKLVVSQEVNCLERNHQRSEYIIILLLTYG